MPATIQMTLEEYQVGQRAREQAEREAARLREEIAQVKLAQPDVKPLAVLARDLLAVVRFAVENLPPEAIKGWPYQRLRAAADALAVLPDFSMDDQSLAIELRNFSEEAARLERARNLQKTA